MKRRIISIEECLSMSKEEQPLLEMATIGIIEANSNSYRIAIHGPATNDSPMPHIHIYLSQDKFPYSLFDFEISVVDLVCRDEIVLVAQIDLANNIRRTHQNDCSWSGYNDLYKSINDFLSNPPMKKVYKGRALNNLQVAIMEWDNENNENMEDNESLMKRIIEDMGYTILPNYLPYFEYIIIQKPKT